MKSPSETLRKAKRAPRPGTGGITLSDVASLAGVSAITVSRALNTPAAVSPETLERVRSAISRSGYVPNLVAGGLASNRSRLVAALVPTIAGPVFLETIQALTDALAEAGCQLILGQSGYSGAREDALIDAIVGRRPDGIVLTGIMHSSEGRRRLLASGIPIVETWDITPTPIDMIVGFFTGESWGRSGRLPLPQGLPKTRTDHRRRPARHVAAHRLRAALRGAGRAAIPACMVPAPSSLANGRSGFAQLWAGHGQTDVVFCGSDVIAQGVITEVQAMGMTVPGDVAVMGFGDMPFAAHTHPALSTVRIDGTSIGRPSRSPTSCPSRPAARPT
jgi:LacI family gluconate utilization system Gnt-I transcriptional repressor